MSLLDVWVYGLSLIALTAIAIVVVGMINPWIPMIAAMVWMAIASVIEYEMGKE